MSLFSCEHDFESALCAAARTYYSTEEVFQIETEETCAGFPDFMFWSFGTVKFAECKYASNHAFEVRRSQLRFYIRHPSMQIHIAVYDPASDWVYCMHSAQILDMVKERGPLVAFRKNGNAVIQLCGKAAGETVPQFPYRAVSDAQDLHKVLCLL